jgi:hypothetical protein
MCSLPANFPNDCDPYGNGTNFSSPMVPTDKWEFFLFTVFVNLIVMLAKTPRRVHYTFPDVESILMQAIHLIQNEKHYSSPGSDIVTCMANIHIVIALASLTASELHNTGDFKSKDIHIAVNTARKKANFIVRRLLRLLNSNDDYIAYGLGLAEFNAMYPVKSEKSSYHDNAWKWVDQVVNKRDRIREDEVPN